MQSAFRNTQIQVFNRLFMLIMNFWNNNQRIGSLRGLLIETLFTLVGAHGLGKALRFFYKTTIQTYSTPTN